MTPEIEDWQDREIRDGQAQEIARSPDAAGFVVRLVSADFVNSEDGLRLAKHRSRQIKPGQTTGGRGSALC